MHPWASSISPWIFIRGSRKAATVSPAAAPETLALLFLFVFGVLFSLLGPRRCCGHTDWQEKESTDGRRDHHCAAAAKGRRSGSGQVICYRPRVCVCVFSPTSLESLAQQGVLIACPTSVTLRPPRSNEMVDRLSGEKPIPVDKETGKKREGVFLFLFFFFFFF